MQPCPCAVNRRSEADHTLLKDGSVEATGPCLPGTLTCVLKILPDTGEVCVERVSQAGQGSLICDVLPSPSEDELEPACKMLLFRLVWL